MKHQETSDGTRRIAWNLVRPGRIASLDGIRAISIALVLLGHLSHTRGFPLHAWFLSSYADFGVRVFFVISGYLITRLLLEERGVSGSINLKNFYARRTIRIFPAAYTYMVVALVIFWSTLSRLNVITALTYTQNFSPKPQWVVGHLWSLAVEEQFYLLWPFLLRRFFVYRRPILWSVVLAVPLINAVLIYSKSPLWGRSFFSVADALAVGCLLAVGKRDSSPALTCIEESRLFWLAPLFAVASAPLLLLKFPLAISIIRTLVWRPLVHFAIAFSIDRAIRKEYMLLNLGPIVWLGTLSYSLYLWQQMFTNSEFVYAAGRFPLNILLIFSSAVGCHYLVEKPLLKLRKRFARPASPRLQARTDGA